MNPMKENRMGFVRIPEEYYRKNKYEDLKIILEDCIVMSIWPGVNDCRCLYVYSPYFKKRKKGEEVIEYKMEFDGKSVSFKEIKNSAEG